MCREARALADPPTLHIYLVYLLSTPWWVGETPPTPATPTPAPTLPQMRRRAQAPLLQSCRAKMNSLLFPALPPPGGAQAWIWGRDAEGESLCPTGWG